MNQSLDALDPRFRPIAVEILARLVEARIPVVIANTLRTEDEQRVAVAAGNSKVARSKHEDGLAIDVVPYEIYMLHGAKKLEYDARDPIWARIGAVVESVPGTRWGGRFRRAGQSRPSKPAGELTADEMGWDPGHVEFAA